MNPSSEDIAGTLVGNSQGGQRTTDIAGAYVYRKSARVSGPGTPETWVEDDRANTLNTFDVGDVRTTHAVVEESVAFAPPVASTLQAQQGRGYAMNAETADGQTVCPTHATVRRLTPLECERLMGWPDGWTDVPWNKKEHSPDSRRYAACGNGVVAPVAYWIGARLAEVLK